MNQKSSVIQILKSVQQVLTSDKVLNPFSSDLGGEHQAEPVPPKSNLLVADLDAAFVQQILHISE